MGGGDVHGRDHASLSPFWSPSLIASWNLSWNCVAFLLRKSVYLSLVFFSLKVYPLVKNRFVTKKNLFKIFFS
jgi:hypothetical protein